MNDVNLQDDETIASVEQSLLGCIFFDPNCWDEVADKIKEEHFFWFQHRHIYKAMCALVKRQKPIDIITVESQLKEAGTLEDIGGASYVYNLHKNTYSAANVKTWIKEVMRYHALRCLDFIGTEISMLAADPMGKSAEEICNYIEGKVYKIQESSIRGGGARSIQDILAKVLDTFDATDEKITPTGFIDLDRITSGGLRPGELILIAGRPGSGKTTLGMNIAENVASQPNQGVLVYSMEMNAESLLLRLLSSAARISQNTLRQPNKTATLKTEDWDKLSVAIKKMQSYDMYIDGTPRLTPSELRSRVKRDSRQLKAPLSLIIVDYLQLMKGDTRYENRVNELGEISGSLKALALEMDVPIIALAQLNRNSVNRAGDKRPTMSDLRDSGSLEQDADMVALIYRDEQYNKDTPDKGLAEVIIDKQRNGETGVFKLVFNGQCNSFLNYRNMSNAIIIGG